MKIMKNIVLLIAVLLLSACGWTGTTGQTDEQPTATDAAIVFDPNTPVKTITQTSVSTATLAPSSTPLPTRTLIPTKLPTLTPTKTQIPTRTPYYCPQAGIGTPCP
jgi:PBP1b-binding outer membrane lipoprotein LpoB